MSLVLGSVFAVGSVCLAAGLMKYLIKPGKSDYLPEIMCIAVGVFIFVPVNIALFGVPARWTIAIEAAAALLFIVWYRRDLWTGAVVLIAGATFLFMGETAMATWVVNRISSLLAK